MLICSINAVDETRENKTMIGDKLYGTEYFDLFKLCEGVFAAIENEKHQAGSNAGIVDLGDFVVVFDSFLDVDAARDLRLASIKLTGKEPSFVINSHSHSDHVIGNSMFSKETRVLSSYKIKELLENEARKDWTSLRERYSKRTKELAEKTRSEKNPRKLLDYENELLFARALMKPDATLRTPDIVFSDSMMFSGRAMMRLRVYPQAHSEEDIIAWLPELRVCFMGDLLFSHTHPWIGSGDPDRLIMALEEILKHQIVTFVPGHGNLATREDVLDQILYVKELEELIEKNADSNKEISIDSLSPIFRNWRTTAFSWNIDFLRRRFKEKDEEVNH